MMFGNLAIDATVVIATELIRSINKSKTVAEQEDITLLENEARLQEIENRISEYQARVAQELAIAKRIETAAEVEIEEFYDTTGSGGVGFQTNESGINLGINGNGRRVVKRVYRFKSIAALEQEEITTEQNPSEGSTE